MKDELVNSIVCMLDSMDVDTDGMSWKRRIANMLCKEGDLFD